MGVVLTSTPEESLLRFGFPPHLARAGRWMLLIALLVAAVLSLVPNPLSVDPISLWVIVAGAAISGLLLAAWTETVEIDPGNSKISVTKGWLGGRRVVLDITPATTIGRWVDGAGNTHVAITQTPESIEIYRGFGPGADVLMERLTSRLQLPVTEDVRPHVGSGSRRVAGAALAVGCLTVVSGVAWPIVNGQNRPQRSIRRMALERENRKTQSYNDAYSILQDGRAVEAEQILRAILKDDPKNIQATNLLAYALSGQKRMDEALASGKAALRLSPDDPTIIDTVGEMHELRKEFKEAERYYRNALVHDQATFEPETRTKLGRTLIALGKPRQATEQLLIVADFQDGGRWSRLARELLAGLGVTPGPPTRVSNPYANFGSRVMNGMAVVR